MHMHICNMHICNMHIYMHINIYNMHRCKSCCCFICTFLVSWYLKVGIWKRNPQAGITISSGFRAGLDLVRFPNPLLKASELGNLTSLDPNLQPHHGSFLQITGYQRSFSLFLAIITFKPLVEVNQAIKAWSFYNIQVDFVFGKVSFPNMWQMLRKWGVKKATFRRILGRHLTYEQISNGSFLPHSLNATWVSGSSLLSSSFWGGWEWEGDV